MSEYEFVVVYIQRDDSLSTTAIIDYEYLRQVAKLPDGKIKVNAICYDDALIAALTAANQRGSVRSIHFWAGPHEDCRVYQDAECDDDDGIESSPVDPSIAKKVAAKLKERGFKGY